MNGCERVQSAGGKTGLLFRFWTITRISRAQFGRKANLYCLEPQLELVTRLLPQGVPYLPPASRLKFLFGDLILGLSSDALCLLAD
jgi:hypothetical protein